MTAVDMVAGTTADLPRLTAGGVWLGVPEPPQDTPTRLTIAAPCQACGGHGITAGALVGLHLSTTGVGNVNIANTCAECEGGGMLVYGTAPITEALPVGAVPTGAATFVIGRKTAGIWRRATDGEHYANKGEIFKRSDLAGTFAPGGVAWRLGPMHTSCPDCGNDLFEMDDCEACDHKGRYAPWAAPNLPTTPGYHRWEAA